MTQPGDWDVPFSPQIAAQDDDDYTDYTRPSDEVTQAIQLLISAGMDPQMAPTLVSDRNIATSLLENRDKIGILAAQYPAAQSLYQQALTEAGTFPGQSFVSQGIVQDPKPQAPSGFSTSTMGYIKYNNGVLADPNTLNVYYPPDKMVPGSPLWLNKASNWSNEKVNAWRKKLANAGYKIAKKGGFDLSLKNALAEHFKQKYLNFGKAVPLDAAGAEADTVTAKEALDPAGLRNEVRAAVRTVYGDEASDGELEYWTQFIRKQFNKRSRHGKTPTAAAGGAQEAFKESFMEDPQVKFYTESQEDNTELRDSLLATVQTINSLA